MAALDANDERYTGLDTQARKSEKRYGELQHELLEWSGADTEEFTRLLGEAWQEILDGEQVAQ